VEVGCGFYNAFAGFFGGLEEYEPIVGNYLDLFSCIASYDLVAF